jgi:predicted nucleic acid-binding protein
MAKRKYIKRADLTPEDIEARKLTQKEYDAARYWKNKEKHNARSAAWYAEHKEDRQVYNAEWHAEHKEERHAYNVKRYNKSKTDVQLLLRSRLYDSCRRAKKYNLPHNLTLATLDALYIAQPYDALTHQEFDLTTKHGSISIDQTESGKGYTASNVRLVRTQTNYALNEFGTAAFDEMCIARVRVLGLLKDSV